MASTEQQNNLGQAMLLTLVKEGDTIAKTDKKGSITSAGVYQSCEIIISNYHTQLELAAPQRYLYSGLCALPPAPRIRPGVREVCLYRQRVGSFYGTAGVLSYDISYVPKQGETDIAQTRVNNSVNDVTKLVLMWSVPSGFGTTYHAVGVLKGKNEPSREMFDKMCTKSDTWFQKDIAANSLNVRGTAFDIPIKVMDSMSSEGNATWKIDFC